MEGISLRNNNPGGSFFNFPRTPLSKRIGALNGWNGSRESPIFWKPKGAWNSPKAKREGFHPSGGELPPTPTPGPDFSAGGPPYPGVSTRPRKLPGIQLTGPKAQPPLLPLDPILPELPSPKPRFRWFHTPFLPSPGIPPAGPFLQPPTSRVTIPWKPCQVNRCLPFRQ